MLGCYSELDDMSVFDVQAESKTSNRVEFRGNESRWEALFYLGFGGGGIYYFASIGGWAGIVGSAVVGLLAILLSFGKAFGEPDRSIHLAFDDEGLSAPHIFEKKLPWVAVDGYSFEGRWSEDRGALFVSVIEPATYKPKPKDPMETWPVTTTGFRPQLCGIAGSHDDIEAAFRQFAPQIVQH